MSCRFNGCRGVPWWAWIHTQRGALGLMGCSPFREIQTRRLYKLHRHIWNTFINVCSFEQCDSDICMPTQSSICTTISSNTSSQAQRSAKHWTCQRESIRLSKKQQHVILVKTFVHTDHQSNSLIFVCISLHQCAVRGIQMKALRLLRQPRDWWNNKSLTSYWYAACTALLDRPGWTAESSQSSSVSAKSTVATRIATCW